MGGFIDIAELWLKRMIVGCSGILAINFFVLFITMVWLFITLIIESAALFAIMVALMLAIMMFSWSAFMLGVTRHLYVRYKDENS